MQYRVSLGGGECIASGSQADERHRGPTNSRVVFPKFAAHWPAAGTHVTVIMITSLVSLSFPKGSVSI